MRQFWQQFWQLKDRWLNFRNALDTSFVVSDSRFLIIAHQLIWLRLLYMMRERKVWVKFIQIDCPHVSITHNLYDILSSCGALVSLLNLHRAQSILAKEKIRCKYIIQKFQIPGIIISRSTNIVGFFFFFFLFAK